MVVAIYLGLILCPPTVERKLRMKHGLTGEHVREALQYPADVRVAWDDHSVHGRRVVATGRVSSGRPLIAWLLPAPAWDPKPEVWLIKSARWMG